MERTYQITPVPDGKWQCRESDADLPLIVCDSPEEAEQIMSDIALSYGRTRVQVFDNHGYLMRDRYFAPAQGMS